MKRISVYFALVLTALPASVLPFSLLRELIFPKVPKLHRVRSLNEASRSLVEDYSVLDFVGLAEKHGYSAEEHRVVTTDGYILMIHRIPGSPKSPPQPGKPIVFLQHGIFGSSDHWVMMGPEKDLAYMLVDRGYDVWMGNVRGNTYSRAHNELSPTDDEFWKFSFHEMAIYDLPAMIDYVLEQSHQTTVYYIGHSMGTTMSYILLSMIPEYNEKIKFSVSLAPVAFWESLPMVPFAGFIHQNFNLLKDFLETNRIGELFPQTTNNARLARGFCSDGSVTQPVCTTFVFLFSGDDPYQFNSTHLPYMLSYFPSGGSSRTIFHYIQNIRAGRFQQYDYGYAENFKVYGRKRPPMYDVKKVEAPFVLIYGPNDPLSTEKNVNELAKRLQHVVAVEKVPYQYFNHLDFIWARDARDLLYNRIIELISMY